MTEVVAACHKGKWLSRSYLTTQRLMSRRRDSLAIEGHVAADRVAPLAPLVADRLDQLAAFLIEDLHQAVRESAT
jgi:hypothetical protein